MDLSAESFGIRAILDYAQIRNSTKSDSEKISSFIEWCKNKGLEEVIIRLSTEDKNWMRENYF